MHSMQERHSHPSAPAAPSASAGPSSNVVWHASAVTAKERERCARQRGTTVWLTGISGSGKSTLAVELERQLVQAGHMALVLDGDNLRHGLNAGIAFDAPGRAEAVRRAGEAALLLAQSGVVAVVSMISPYRAHRLQVRARHAAAGVPFIEVFVDAPLAVAEGRDPKGLYARARAGEIRGFTGVDDPYEAPETPEVHVRTDQQSPRECVQAVRSAISKCTT